MDKVIEDYLDREFTNVEIIKTNRVIEFIDSAKQPICTYTILSKSLVCEYDYFYDDFYQFWLKNGTRQNEVKIFQEYFKKKFNLEVKNLSTSHSAPSINSGPMNFKTLNVDDILLMLRQVHGITTDKKETFVFKNDTNRKILFKFYKNEKRLEVNSNVIETGSDKQETEAKIKKQFKKLFGLEIIYIEWNSKSLDFNLSQEFITKYRI